MTGNKEYPEIVGLSILAHSRIFFVSTPPCCPF